MTVSDTLTYDLATPIRPGLTNIRNGVKTNDSEIPVDQPCAEEHNQMAQQIAALNKVNPVLIISCSNATTPAAISFTTPGGSLLIGDFTVADTTGGATGDTTISWSALKLPTSLVQPMAFVNGNTPAMISASMPTSTSVRVITKDAANAAVDVPFTVMLV